MWEKESAWLMQWCEMRTWTKRILLFAWCLTCANTRALFFSHSHFSLPNDVTSMWFRDHMIICSTRLNNCFSTFHESDCQCTWVRQLRWLKSEREKKKGTNIPFGLRQKSNKRHCCRFLLACLCLFLLFCAFVLSNFHWFAYHWTGRQNGISWYKKRFGRIRKVKCEFDQTV